MMRFYMGKSAATCTTRTFQRTLSLIWDPQMQPLPSFGRKLLIPEMTCQCGLSTSKLLKEKTSSITLRRSITSKEKLETSGSLTMPGPRISKQAARLLNNFLKRELDRDSSRTTRCVIVLPQHVASFLLLRSKMLLARTSSRLSRDTEE